MPTILRSIVVAVSAILLAACGGANDETQAPPDETATEAPAQPDIARDGITAASITGDWSGELKVPGGPTLPLIFHIEEAEDGGFSVSLDSPLQGAMGIPGENARIEEGAFKASFPVVGAEFMAEPGEGDTLKAAWMQGLPLPIAFNRPQEPTERPYVIEEVSFPGGAEGVTLAGELTLPEGEGPFPAVVLISGSGPQDRNEELMNHKPFLIISDDLTRKGFAVLRYDDRGVADSTGDHSLATTEDFAMDAAAALAFLKTDGRVDAARTAYVGHSEGGIIAPLAAPVERPAAMVLLAGPTETLASVAVYQSRELVLADGGTQAQADAAADALEQAFGLLRANEDLDTVLEKTIALYEDAGLPRGMAESRARFTASPWMKWVMDYDPVPALEAYDGPVLALFGGLDKQVAPSENAAAMEEALSYPGSEVVVLEGLNHLFQPAQTGGMAEYATIEITFDEKALDTVSDWLDRNL